ncbi:MAG: bifunctional 3,4-dihydroxy-2-butanone-4-phosphate synthase/GTP cyclohydrolase II [Candidatus Eremiobacteraeota bacterium]|nr:bifunctional 3,4-dihydroxy-2-butanone-4-phosphate synthase/GTP cyclohydrolase II [Candidatus Eremiobacteraeota bacterium]
MSEYSTIEEALEDIRQGKIIIVVDDEDRENEGDFIMAAEKCTPETMNILIKHGSGFVCAPTTGERLHELDIPMMVGDNTSRLGTAMTVTVDAREGTTTGVSAGDRATTVLKLADPAARADDFTRPGHIVPLRAERGGVLRRAGHTEASVDLCRLAGLAPMGVLAEVMNDDGSMARTPELLAMARRLDMRIITIADLISYRRTKERLIERTATTTLPTANYGTLTVHAYESSVWTNPAIALVKGDLSGDEPVLVRVHSSCVTGDLLSSLRCDCGTQLHLALERIHAEGRGAVIYLEQEGRGIGLVNKMKAYELQDKGDDTVVANARLGFKPDLRDYGIGAQIMLDLGLKKVRFMTNNPAKVKALDGYGLEIVEWVGLPVEPNPHNLKYLKTKRGKMGHLFPAELLKE